MYLVESRSCIPKAPEQKRSISPSLFHSDLESELVRRKGRIGNHATLLKDIIEKKRFRYKKSYNLANKKLEYEATNCAKNIVKSHKSWLRNKNEIKKKSINKKKRIKDDHALEKTEERTGR